MNLELGRGGALMGFLLLLWRWSAQEQKQVGREQVNLVIRSGLVAVTLEPLLWAEIFSIDVARTSDNLLISERVASPILEKGAAGAWLRIAWVNSLISLMAFSS